MHRRSLSLIALLLIVSALPLSASQFIDQPFDHVARESAFVVRGTVGDTWSAWDDAHEVIYTYATVRVTATSARATGPDTLLVREVGGTVDGYTQEAIGFPAIRRGEDVVLFLSQWEDSADYRIHAFNQGKFLVRNRGGVEVLIADPVKQGDERLAAATAASPCKPPMTKTGLTIDEFAQMVDARARRRRPSTSASASKKGERTMKKQTSSRSRSPRSSRRHRPSRRMAYVLLSPRRRWASTPVTVRTYNVGNTTITDGSGGVNAVVSAIRVWGIISSSSTSSAAVRGSAPATIMLNTNGGLCTGGCLAATLTGYYVSQSGDDRIYDADVYTNTSHNFYSSGESAAAASTTSTASWSTKSAT